MRNGNPHLGATFAERKAARLDADKADRAVETSEAKAVDSDESGVEDKAVETSEAKRPRRTTRKKS